MVWLTDWTHRVKLTSDNTKVSAAVKGLAVDLSHMPAGFWSTVKSDGADIRVTASDGETLVARDVVSIDTVGEKGLVRFDTSGISTSANTDYYLYYGNENATEPGKGTTYDANLVSYWAFNETSGTTAKDSAGSNNGTLNTDTIWSSEGKLDSAIDFGSANNYVNTGIAGNSVLTGSFTYKLWVNMNDLTQNKDLMGHRGVGIAVTLLFNSSDGFRSWLYRSANYTIMSNIIPTLGEYNMLTLTFNGSTKVATMFVNGVSVGTVNVGGQPTLGTNPIIIGNGYRDATTGSYTYGVDAKIDEPVLFNRELSDSEDLTYYNNESSNDTFWTFGSQEETSTGGTIKYYNGASFVDKPVKYYNGTEWISAPSIKVYNGSTWS